MSHSSTLSSNHEPLITPAQAALARVALDEIVDDLRGMCAPGASPKSTVAAGAAALFAVMARMSPGRGYQEDARALIELAVDQSGGEELALSFGGGFLTLAYFVDAALALLGERPVMSSFAVEVLESVHMAGTWDGPFDLLAGVAGHLVYLMHAAPERSALAAQMVRALASQSHLYEKGVSWCTPEARLDLGVAHGLTGVMMALASAKQRGIEEESCARLLRESLNCLRHHTGRDEPLGHGPRLPPFGGGVDSTSVIARVAWCYGDAGAAAVLTRIGRALDDADYTSFAAELCDGLLLANPDEFGVEDASVCHGSTGIALLMSDLYDHTKRPELMPGVRDWVDRTLNYRAPGVGGGYLYVQRGQNTCELTEDRSFLQGTVGVGLGLVTLLRPDLPRCWLPLLLPIA